MQRKLSDTLPGFMMYNEFFGALKGDFKPVVLSDLEKNAVLAKIAALDGEPWECWMLFRDDFSLSGILREAREYADGRLYVRVEFRRISYYCEWSEPYQLMAVCRKDGTIENYTVFCGSGRMVEPLQFGMSDGWHDWSKYTTTDDMAEALAHLAKPGKRQLGVRHSTIGHCDIYVYSLDGRCSIEWFMCCEPWMLSATDLGLDEVEAMLKAVETGGLKALGSMREWRQLDYPGDYRQYGVNSNIDCELKRLLELAKKQGEEMRARTVRAFGIGEDRIDKPYAFWIKSGTMAEEQSLLFNVAVNEQDKAKAAKLFAVLAMRGHLESQNNLGWHFHFGIGVPVDYDLAIYWHTQAANAGVAFAMTNLGKIYSEKNSPKWDGQKAICWFKKAAERGETWAMGELGHCLLCGECIGRDVAKARVLLEKAVAKNPNRKDFAANLAKARQEEE